MENSIRQCDVVIVGLGPTGAMLANLLGQDGWSVVVLERDDDIYYAPKAVHFDDEVMRIFQAAGLSEPIGQTSESFRDMEFTLKPTGEPALRMVIGEQDGRYGHPGAWWFHQPTLEKQLRDGLNRFDKVTSITGASVTRIEQQTDHVVATAQSRDGQTFQVRGQYLIGCDGGRSFVRKEVGIKLESADFDEAWVVVDTKTRSGKKDPNLPSRHRQTCDPKQPVTYVPMAGPYYEWQFMVTDGKSDSEATDPHFVRQQLRKFVDLNTIEINRIALYRFHGLWAKEWRKGRVLLAGDAAHQMPPFLGQGMCSGIRDAHCLGWRLDLVLAGKAKPACLDDYITERNAHVKHIINGAMFLGRVIQTRHPVIAYLRNNFLFRPANFFPAFNRFFEATANRKRPMDEGFFGLNNKKLAGHLSIQPAVTTPNKSTVALDDLFGNGFALLGRAGVLNKNNPVLKRLLGILPIQIIEFDRNVTATSVADSTGKLGKWFEKHNADFMLIRPDRYVYDAGKIADLDHVLANFSKLFAQ